MHVIENSATEEVPLLQAALDAAGVGVWQYDAGAELAKADRLTAKMFRLSDQDRHAADLQKFLDVIHPEDVDMASSAIIPGRPFDVAYRIVSDGPDLWVRSIGRWGDRGGATLLIGVTIDITEERARQERLELLAQEMRHRVGNTFAILGGLVSLEAEEADSAADLADKLRDRLAELSQAQSLSLRDGQIEPERSLSGLIDAVARPFLSQTKGRFATDGPEVSLPDDVSTVLSLVFYEWLTNALKYGAFSDRSGKIFVRWRIDDIGLSLTWDECTSEAKAMEPTSGFGEKMQQAALAPIGGVIKREWTAKGLRLNLRLPLSDQI